MKATAAFMLGLVTLTAQADIQVAPEQARAIAKEAYLYGFPMVENYKTLYLQAFDHSSHDYKGPLNQITHTARVFTPADKVVVTPNSDTPYSSVWLDLRAEPMVLTLPKMDSKRYFSVQLIDLYTFNFDYLGTRTSGSNGGKYLIAGPSWQGNTPTGIQRVIRSETEIAYALYRTQLFGPDDLDKVKQVQAGYQVEPLSAYLGQPAPPQPPALAPPAYDAKAAHSSGFFQYLNYLLQFAPAPSSETALRERFKQIGVEPGKPFSASDLSPDIQQALIAGIDDAEREFSEFKEAKLDTHQVGSDSLFGTRAFMQNNYLYRYAGARLGIYGNSRDEAYYVGYFIDGDKQPLNAAQHRYAMRFAADQLPPAKAFWSLTLYDGKSQLLIDNPLDRYLINSPMLPSLKRDVDGGLTLYLQRGSPGADREANWLPAPDGPFYVMLRLYLPEPAVINGQWQQPPIQKLE
jgi:hypothetical protein